MRTTTSRRPWVLEEPSAPIDPSAAPLGDEPDRPAEVLIREARRRQRRRWAFCALAVVAVIGLVAGLLDALGASPPTGARHGRAVASPGEVAAFLSRAEKGFSGRFVLRYAVQYGTGRHAVSGSVVATQDSKSQAYISTPPIADIHAADSSSSVLVNPLGEEAGRYQCGRETAASPWSCSSFSTAGMGTNAELLGPYPPTALILGLQNAVVEYSGKPTGERVAPEPAHLVLRDVDARKLSCLAFGNPAMPVALVCLNAASVITSYHIPRAVSNIAYTTAELRSRSRHVPDAALTLPARPATAAPVPGTPPCGGSQGGSGVRPELIAVGCAAAAAYLEDITWEKRNGAALDGLAELYTRSANGTFTSAQVKIGLSNPGYLGGRLVFRTLSFTTATGPPRTLTVPGESWGWLTSGD